MKTMIVFFLILSAVVPAFAVENIKAPHVKISWIAPDKISTSKPDTIGLQFLVDPEWHIYWKNSGDSGAPPKFEFKDSTFSIGPAQWPIPKRIPVGHLVNIGYEKQVVFLFQVSPNIGANELKLSLNLEWLVCKEECIPGLVEMSLSRPLTEGDSVWKKADKTIIEQFASLIPRTDPSPWELKLVEKSEGKLVVAVSKKDSKSTSWPELFPIDGEGINPQAPATAQVGNDMHYTFSTPAVRNAADKQSFLLAADSKSWEHEISISTASDEEKTSSTGTAQASFISLLFFAFLGGIILNLMPCVLPVLSIKFLSLMKTSAAERRKDALLYLAGVMTTFFALGAVFLILRSAGAAIGWGFQLQSPYIILFLILLFWFMSLNFLGVFEFGEAITNIAGNTNRTGSFSTGILAVFVAAPCTGPFMGTALGASATLPAVQALGIFLSLGLGLGFPFVLVSFAPSFYKLIPKPGAWMERLKQFLAFPLLGTVIWLMWVLGIQLGTDGWLLACTLLLLIAFGFWIGKSNRKFLKTIASVLIVTAVCLGFVAIPKFQSMATAAENKVTTGWTKFDPEQIKSARTKGQSVFVDFTAAWCITCQVNKKTVLETDKITKLFQDNNVLAMRADWTNQDPVITKTLAEFNRNSVPVYLFYDKGADAEILPQILTINMIEKLFNKQKE
jgi:thiol:disulfide interchange protein